MNPKLLFVAFLLAMVAIGAYLFSRTGQSDGVGELQNTSQAAQPASKQVEEASLVGEGKGGAAHGLARQEVPADRAQSKGDAKEQGQAKAAISEVFAHVVDEDGTGLEGVEVAIRQILPEAGWDFNPWASPKVAKVQSDADGRVTLSVAAGPFAVKLSRAGFVVREIEFQTEVEPGEDLGLWKLTRALMLSGRVVGPNGNPVAGAKIIAPQTGGLVVFMVGEVDSIAETDEAGRFQIDNLEPGAWRLMVHSQEYPDQIFSGAATQETHQSGLLWTLKAGAALRGRVVGRPASSTQDLEVNLSLTGQETKTALLGNSAEGFPAQPRVVDVAPDGTFLAAGLHAETEYVIRVNDKIKKQGMFLGDRNSLCEIKTVSSSAGTVDLLWSNQASFRMLVVNDETSEPVEKFQLAPSNFQYFSSLSSEEDHPGGLMEVAGVPPSKEPFSIRIQAEGFEPYNVEALEFQASTLTDLGTIRLQPGKVVRVHVTDATTGESVKNARVDLTSKRVTDGDTSLGEMVGFSMDPMGEDAMRQTGKTDDEGFVSLRYMEGSKGSVTVKHPRYATEAIYGVDLESHRMEPIEVSLWYGGELLVNVIDTDEEPAKGVQVQLERTGEKGPGMAFSFGGGMQMGSAELSKKTNAKGFARFEHLPAGEYLCTVSWPGSGSSNGFVVFMGSPEGEGDSREPAGLSVTIREGGVAELTMAAPLRSSLEGIILENGAPLVGARVTADKPGGFGDLGLLFGGQESGVRTDRDGHFSLENLDPGPVIVTVHHELRVMDFTEEIQLHEGLNVYRAELQVTTISGRVVDSSGTGIEGIRVSAESTSGGSTSQRVSASIMIMDDSEGGVGISSSTSDGRKPVITDAEGRFELRGVTPGKPLRVVAEGQELRTARTDEMTLPNGGLRSGVELTMVPGCQLTVKVVNERGEAVSHVMVTLEFVKPGDVEGEETKSPGPNSVTNDLGLVVFDTLEIGTYEISASPLFEAPQDNPSTTRVQTSLSKPEQAEVRID